MARERVNGYLHPDVVVKLEEIASTNKYRSIFPAIEECVKQLYAGQLDHIVPGKYGTDCDKESFGNGQGAAQQP